MSGGGLSGGDRFTRASNAPREDRAIESEIELVIVVAVCYFHPANPSSYSFEPNGNKRISLHLAYHVLASVANLKFIVQSEFEFDRAISCRETKCLKFTTIWHLAHEEAKTRRHTSLDTEHLLLGIMRDDSFVLNQCEMCPLCCRYWPLTGRP